MTIFRVIAFLLFLSAQALGSTYYVATTGNDTNPGTFASPFKTVQKGVDEAVAGDTVMIASGTYSENVRTADNAGSAGSPITINGQGVATIGSFSWENPYIHLINCTITGGTNLWGGFLYVSQSGSHCVLSNCTLDVNYDMAISPVIRWSGPSASPFGTAGSDNTIVSNTIKNIRGEMVFRIFGDRNLIYKNSLLNADNTDWFQVFGRTNYIVANLCSNLFYGGVYNTNNHSDVIQTYLNSGLYGSEGHIVESNLIIKADELAQVANLTDDNSSDVKDITFRNNIFVGVSAKASCVMPELKFYNNIFVDCSTNTVNGGSVLNFGDTLVGKAHSCKVINNIFLDCGIPGSTNNGDGWYLFDTTLTNVAADYNYVGKDGFQAVDFDTLHRGVGDPGGWDKWSWWETNGINGGNPLMTDPANFDYSVGTNSILVAGNNLYSLFTTDFAGYSRPTGGVWTIGPLEAQPGSGSQPPTVSSEPSDTSVYAGASATFSVTASGTSPFTYQWKLDGTNISGATNSSYTTNFTTLDADGNAYSVGITNAYGGVVSSNATLTVSVYYDELDCYVDPRSIRAYSVANTNVIYLFWPTNDIRQALWVSRREYTNRPSAWNSWSSLYTNTLTPTQQGQYIDTTVNSGIHYEYFVSSLVTNWVCGGDTNLPYWDYEYISTGTKVPVKDTRGNLILIVETNLASSIVSELTTLTNDLIADGYKVYLHEVLACDVDATGWTSAVASVRSLISTDYNSDTNSDWTLYLLGHVPVPYSGESSPGSHSENFGAHPSDWYYGDLNGTWTDTTVSNLTATNIWDHNWNIPGDGKYDQSYIPSAPELRVGRLDLTNMPAFSMTQAEVVKQYLDRVHLWKIKGYTARDRGIVYYYTLNGNPYNSHSVCASVFGGGDVADVGDWLNNAGASTNSYLISDKAGSGQYTEDLQLGTTDDFATTNLYTVFSSMYGSYYGDWDSGMHSDQVLQAPLCSDGYTVSVFYRGYMMTLNAMSMDETISQELFSAAANYYATLASRYTRFAWIAGGTTNSAYENLDAYITLMGDPTLRLRMTSPPTNVIVTASGTNNSVSWTASSDTNIAGYHVYRAPTSDLNDFTRLTTSVTTSPYSDSGAAGGAYTYMVRAIKLEESLNRSYYNASLGVFGAASGIDTNAPSISNVLSTPYSSTCIVTWDIDESCTNAVYCSEDPGESWTNSVSSASFTTSPSLQLTGLKASTTYNVYVFSQDSSGNSSTNRATDFTTIDAASDPTLQRIAVSGDVVTSGASKLGQ